MPAPPPVTRREILAWAMFDFANSSYTTLIVTVAFSVYFTKLVAPGPYADFLWGLGITVSNFVVMLSAPFIGAAADVTGRKRELLGASALLCIVATAALTLVEPGDALLALLLFIASNTGFALGENLIAAFLPELSTPENIGRVSGLGWAIGYLGGLACLVACWPFLAGGFTAANLDGLKSVWLVTAAFFLVGSLPTFLLLRERVPKKPWSGIGQCAQLALGRIRETAAALATFRDLARFLATFLCFMCGLATIISFASIFAERTLGFTTGELILLFVALQVSATAGAALFGLLQDKIGARRTIEISLLLWISVCVSAFLVEAKTQFWGVALIAGLGIGSLQSASRALVGTLSPLSKTGEFFGLWGLAGKGAAMLGPIVFGAVSSASGSQRIAILTTAAFFIAGLAGLRSVNEERGRTAAAEWREPEP